MRIIIPFLLVASLLTNSGIAQMTMVYDNDYVSYNRGLELLEKQKFGQAKHQFEEAITIIQDQNSELSANAHFYVAQCALELFHKDAEFLLKEFIKNYSTSTRVPDAWFLLGNYNFRKKKWEEAIEYFNQLQEINLVEPRKSEYLFKKGYSYFQIDSLDQAAAMFFQMDDYTSVYKAPGTYYLGHINYAQKKYAAALKNFDSLREHEQFGDVVPYYIVQIYHFQENYDEVISYGTPFLNDRKVKRQAEISRVVGDAHYNLEQYDEAVPFLDMFMSQNGNNRTGWSDAEYDKTIRLANDTTDTTKRNALFKQAESKLINESLPIFPLYFYVGINIYHPDRIGGIHQNILDIHPINAIYAK